jgi:hypothetical protein
VGERPGRAASPRRHAGRVLSTGGSWTALRRGTPSGAQRRPTGLSSGSRIVLPPEPSHALRHSGVASRGVVPGYSGGSAGALHPSSDRRQRAGGWPRSRHAYTPEGVHARETWPDPWADMGEKSEDERRSTLPRAQGRPFRSAAGPPPRACVGAELTHALAGAESRGIDTPWGCSSSGRALEWHSRGKGFDSPQLHHPFRAARKAVVRNGQRCAVRASAPVRPARRFARSRPGPSPSATRPAEPGPADRGQSVGGPSRSWGPIPGG